jgi:hypothetical protein
MPAPGAGTIQHRVGQDGRSVVTFSHSDHWWYLGDSWGDRCWCWTVPLCGHKLGRILGWHCCRDSAGYIFINIWCGCVDVRCSKYLEQLIFGFNLWHFVLAVPPTIVVSNRDQSVREGETVTLQCQITGTPQPQVTWEKQGGSLPSNSDIRNDVLTWEATYVWSLLGVHELVIITWTRSLLESSSWKILFFHSVIFKFILQSS